MRSVGGAVLVSVLFAVTPAASAQVVLDPLVVIGGYAGHWDTQLELSNPFSYPMLILIQGDSGAFGTACPSCASASIELPPNGSVQLSAKADLAEPEGFRALYVLAAFPSNPLLSSGPWAVVNARLVNTARPSQGTDLPISRLSAISSETGFPLSFPSAARAAGVHSNLVLSRIGASAGDLPVRIEVFARSGEQLASATRVIPAGSSSVSVVDVLGQAGVATIDGAQVRVTPAGGAMLWGLLATSFDDGRITASSGRNP